MTEEFELSRRKALAGLATVGAAGAGAGLGTSALFSDEESFEDNMITAGTLNLIVDHYWYLDQGVAGTFQGSFDGSDDTGDPLDGDTFTYTASDVKPGDDGLFAFCPRIDDNPAYLWLQGELTANDDNGLTEPEGDVDETGGEGEGELARNIDVTVSYCDIDDDVADQPEGDEDPSDDGFGPDDMTVVAEVWSGSLAGLLEELEAGLPLDGGVVEPGEEPIGFPELGTQGCFAGTGEEGENYCLCFDWEVPEDVGNVIQSDSLSFDLTLYAEQCRHNDGATNPFEEEEEEEETQTPMA